MTYYFLVSSLLAGYSVVSGTDKASGITNDPNDWAEEQGKPRYILDLLLSVITVSVDTVKIVNGLPGLEVATESAGR